MKTKPAWRSQAWVSWVKQSAAGSRGAKLQVILEPSLLERVEKENKTSVAQPGVSFLGNAERRRITRREAPSDPRRAT